MPGEPVLRMEIPSEANLSGDNVRVIEVSLFVSGPIAMPIARLVCCCVVVRVLNNVNHPFWMIL